jgi:hypothetical protein
VTLISGFAVAMIFMILLLVVKPSFLVGPSDIVMTERIIQNSLQIRSALGGSDIALIKILGIKDHRADVVITGTSGNSVNANVDLKQGTVKVTITIVYVTIDQIRYMITADFVTRLSNEDKESALNIAKTDPVSSTLFSEGALITGINPAHVYATSEITPNDSGKPGTITMTIRERSFGEHPPIIVELTTAKGVQSILVDLNAGKVIKIITGIVGLGQPTLKP